MKRLAEVTLRVARQALLETTTENLLKKSFPSSQETSETSCTAAVLAIKGGAVAICCSTTARALATFNQTRIRSCGEVAFL